MSVALNNIKNAYFDQLEHSGIPVSGQMHIIFVSLLALLLSILVAINDPELGTFLFVLAEFVGLLLIPKLTSARYAKYSCQEALSLLGEFKLQLEAGEPASEALITSISKTKTASLAKEFEFARAQLLDGVQSQHVLSRIAQNTPASIAKTILIGMSISAEVNRIFTPALEELSQICRNEFDKKSKLASRISIISKILLVLAAMLSSVFAYVVIGIGTAWWTCEVKNIFELLFPLVLVVVQLYLVALVQMEVWND